MRHLKALANYLFVFSIVSGTSFAPAYASDILTDPARLIALRFQQAETFGQLIENLEMPNDKRNELRKFIAKKRPHDVIDAVNLVLSNKAIRSPHILFVGSGELGSPDEGGRPQVIPPVIGFPGGGGLQGSGGSLFPTSAADEDEGNLVELTVYAIASLYERYRDKAATPPVGAQPPGPGGDVPGKPPVGNP